MVKLLLLLSSTSILQGSILTLNQCNVRNGATNISLSASGPQDCALSTPSNGVFAPVFADASTTASMLAVSASVLGFSPINPYTSAASTASVQESEDLDSEGPERPGFLMVSFISTGGRFDTVWSQSTVAMPGLFRYDFGAAHLQNGCNFATQICDFAVTLGLPYEVDLSAIATGYGDAGYGLSAQASATVQFFEADGKTPAPFADPQSAPEPGSWMLAGIALLALGVNASGMRRSAAGPRN